MGRLLIALVLAVAIAATLAAQSAPSPALTDLDRAELQIVALQRQVVDLSDQLGACRAQLAPLVSQANKAAMDKLQAEAVARIEARHPGSMLDLQTGALAPKPAALSAAPKK